MGNKANAGPEARPPEDGEIVNIAGQVLDAGDGVALVIHQEVLHGADVMTSVRIRYTAADGAVTGHDVGIAVDGFGNREKWDVAWVRGTKTLWHVNGEFEGKRLRLYRTDFADPHRIVTAYDAKNQAIIKL